MKKIREKRVVISLAILIAVAVYSITLYINADFKSRIIEVLLLSGLTGVLVFIVRLYVMGFRSKVASICIVIYGIWIICVVNIYLYIYWEILDFIFIDKADINHFTMVMLFILVMIGIMSFLVDNDFSWDINDIFDDPLKVDGIVFRNCEESDKHFLKEAFKGKELPWNHVNTDTLDEENDYADSLKTILMHFDGLSIYSMIEQDGQCQGIVWLERMSDRAELHCVFTKDVEKVLEIIEKMSLYYMDLFDYQKLDLSLSYIKERRIIR